MLFVLGLAAAGGLSAGVVAATTTTGTTTTAGAGHDRERRDDLGRPGRRDERRRAFAAVTASFARPLTLVVPRHRLAVAPARIGAMGAVRASVCRALTVPADTALKLR